ncbi:MAG: hypothetical protein PSN04_10535 [Methyloprofundus sp.]|nr:hypothetical protein [Methyloprofundus sp.]
MTNIPEQDWKKIRSLKDKVLNAVCADILNEINKEYMAKGNDNHKAYLKTWDIVNTKDKDIADMFNDLRRSNAIFKLALWYQQGYLTDNDAKEFTEQTYKTIQAICK